MISEVVIEGLGPFRSSTSLKFPARSVLVTGASEAGKTTIVRAIVFCLFGTDLSGSAMPVEAINDHCDGCSVEVRLPTGVAFMRSLRKKDRKIVRTVRGADGGETVYGNEREWAERLGKLGSDYELARVVLAPGIWEPMTYQNARQFRDLIGRVLPQDGMRRAVQDCMEARGFDLKPESPLSEPACLDLRKSKKDLFEKMDVRWQAARETLALLEEDIPTTSTNDVEAARAIVGLAEEWKAWRRANADAQAEAVAFARREERAERWAKEFNELGPRPTGTEVDLEALREASKRAAAQLAQADEAVFEARQSRTLALESKNEALAAAQKAMDEAPTSSKCPQCGRSGWAEAKERRAKAEEELRIAKADEFDWGVRRQKLIEHRTEALKKAEAAQQEARQAQQEARQALEDAGKPDAAARWDARRAELGPAPSDPGPEPVLPEPLDVPEPSPEAVQAARETVRTADEARGAAQEHSRQVDRANEALATAERAMESARMDLRYAEALLQSVREAPSRLLEGADLRQIGPVTLELGDNPAIRVLIDGRPWQMASSGRRIVADLALRAALRNAWGVGWLPIFADQVQDVGGQPVPDIPAPVVHLGTDHSKKMRLQPLPPTPSINRSAQ